MKSRPNTHVRLSTDLAERLRQVSEQISVPVTRLLDHIVEDALPIYEKEAFKAPMVKRPEGLPAVPGVNDPRSPAQIAQDAAREAKHHATEANRHAQVAKAWEGMDKATELRLSKERGPSPQVVIFDEVPEAPAEAKCPHINVKTLSWGGKVCEGCGSVLRRT